jgi:tRNA(fMet)-specific endonuclease VapC
MRRFLFDSGIAQDYAQRRDPVFRRAGERTKRGDKIGVRTPIYAELRGGLELSTTRDRNLQRLIVAMDKLVLWPFDERAAEECGRLYAVLERAGRPMQTIDIQLAAVALALGNTTVVSKDSDLFAVPGLSVENWSVEVPTP